MRVKIILFTLNVCSAFVIPSTNIHRCCEIRHYKSSLRVNKLNTLMCQQKENIKIKSLPIKWSKEKGIQLFDIQTTPEIWAIALVYFVQGILGISRLALTFYYKDILHLEPADLSMISSISIFPWVIKPLYGFISDTYPLFGYKRKSYLILSGILGTLSWIFLYILVQGIELGNYQIDSTTISASILLVMMSSLGVAFSDVLVDAIVVNKSRNQNEAGSLQSLCWTSTAIGSIISSIFSGSLVQNYGPKFVFSITAIIPLIITAVSRLIEEEKILVNSTNHLSIKRQINDVWNALSQKSIIMPIIFLVMWQATPSCGSALFYFETNVLGFQPDFLGKLGLVSSISSLLGVILYNQKLKTIPLDVIFKWSCISGTILGMTPLLLVTHTNRVLGLPDTWFAIGDDIILTILGQIAFMPILVLAAKICPPGVEGMLFATIMSINNLSGGIGSFLGGLLTKYMGVTNNDFTNLPLLMIITNLTGLLPLMFLHFIPKEEIKKE